MTFSGVKMITFKRERRIESSEFLFIVLPNVWHRPLHQNSGFPVHLYVLIAVNKRTFILALIVIVNATTVAVTIFSLRYGKIWVPGRLTGKWALAQYTAVYQTEISPNKYSWDQKTLVNHI